MKYNWYTGFDDTDTVDVVSDIEGEMAMLLDEVFYKCQFGPVYVWCHAYPSSFSVC